MEGESIKGLPSIFFIEESKMVVSLIKKLLNNLIFLDKEVACQNRNLDLKFENFK